MANLLHVLAWNQLAVVPLAATVWAVSRARLIHERPALRHGLWLLVLLKFVTPALIPLAFLPAVADERNLKFQLPIDEVMTTQDLDVTFVDPTVESRDTSVEQAEYSAVTQRKAEFNGDGDPASAESVESQKSVTQAINIPSDARLTSRIWLPVVSVLALSLLVSVWLWVTAIHQVWRIRRLMSRSGCELSHAVRDALQDVSQCFGLQKEPRLLVVDESISPMLWAGSGRSTIVLPRTLTMSIGDDQLRHILAHELAHFVRRDHWGNLLSFVVTSLFWWNPVAWLARRELRTAAESCCDAMAINRLAGSRKSYAETLLAVVDFVTSTKPFKPTLATTFGASRSLKRRIEMIANPNVKTSLSRSGLLLVACGVVSLTLLPARAQQEAPNKSNSAAEKQSDIVRRASDGITPAQAQGPSTADDPSDVGAIPNVQQPADDTPPPVDKRAAGGGPHEIVNQFLDRLREGKKTINGIHGSWQHVWELTTRETGAGWGHAIMQMNQNPCCLPRHSGVFCASSRRRTEQLRWCEVSVRFQQRAKHAMIGACPRPLALNADTTIVFENLFKRPATSSLPSGMACPGQRRVAGSPRQPPKWCLWTSLN